MLSKGLNKLSNFDIIRANSDILNFFSLLKNFVVVIKQFKTRFLKLTFKIDIPEEFLISNLLAYSAIIHRKNNLI